MVCGAATVMVGATDPDADLRPLRAVGGRGARRGDRLRAIRRRGRAGSPGDHPLPIRRAGSRRGGRARAVPSRRRGRAPHGGAPDRQRGRVLAGFRLSRRAPRPAGAACPGGRARARSVPAGSVAIANGHAAVYPTASPGGWHLVGRTAFPLFSPERPPYAVLAPGDRVRFTVAGADEAAAPRPVTPPAWSLPPERAARSSRCWSRGCAPWSRTVAAARVAAGGRPRRRSGRPGVLHAWPTGWPATR